jgi:hypothetical protein
MADAKKWYQSKVVWLGVLTTLLGVFPLINEYVKVIAPAALITVEASLTLIAGIVTVILRIWFTDQPIA